MAKSKYRKTKVKPVIVIKNLGITAYTIRNLSEAVRVIGSSENSLIHRYESPTIKISIQGIDLDLIGAGALIDRRKIEDAIRENKSFELVIK